MMENLESQLKKIQDRLFEMMILVHKLCEENDIKYYMIGGTFLGAVRHKDFIPWDDDIDIGIPRDDYMRLINLPISKWPKSLIIRSPIISDNHPYAFSKIIDKNSTLVEDYGKGIVQGLYIDVFPIDRCGKSWRQAQLSHKKISTYIKLLQLTQLYDFQNKAYWKRLIIRIAKLFGSKTWLKLIDKNLLKNSSKPAKYLGNCVGAWGIKEIMEESIFGQPTLYKFRESYFYGPEKYHDYLSSLYGNYMELPPPEKRKSHHKFKYINLNLPFEEYINLKNEADGEFLK